MSKELEALEKIGKLETTVGLRVVPTKTIVKDFAEYNIIETALKDYEELLKIDCKQNTINDFYPNTKLMIDDLLNLVCTKMCDFLKEGETYTKTRMLELLGTAIRYVKTFAYGNDFNETEKVGAKAKKLKALEIIKKKHVDCFKLIAIFMTSNNLEHYNQNYGGDWQLTQEEFDLLKEVLL